MPLPTSQKFYKKMTVCTFDNPDTMCREFWQDGKLICVYDYALLPLLASNPEKNFFLGANIGDWEAGRLVGDAKAMDNN
jgi:hypothetical protein